MGVKRLNSNIISQSTERLIEEDSVKAKNIELENTDGTSYKVPKIKAFFDNSVTMTNNSTAEITKNTVTIPAGTFAGTATLIIRGAVPFYQSSTTTGTYLTTSRLKVNGTTYLTNSKNAQMAATDDDFNYSRMTDVMNWTAINIDNTNDIVITITGQWSLANASWQIQAIPLSVIAIQE